MLNQDILCKDRKCLLSFPKAQFGYTRISVIFLLFFLPFLLAVSILIPVHFKILETDLLNLVLMDTCG